MSSNNYGPLCPPTGMVLRAERVAEEVAAIPEVSACAPDGVDPGGAVTGIEDTSACAVKCTELLQPMGIDGVFTPRRSSRPTDGSMRG